GQVNAKHYDHYVEATKRNSNNFLGPNIPISQYIQKKDVNSGNILIVVELPKQ
ncbi:hypothetical protein BGX20_006174, partial [Mortierella sp. AD010]